MWIESPQAAEKRRARMREYMRVQRQKDPERHREAVRRWRSANREKSRAASRAWRLADPVKARAMDRRQRLNRKYGLTVADYERMCAERDGKCDLCRRAPAGRGHQAGRLVVDHCHATGRVRGLLCFHCNTAVGKLRDDPALCEAAAAYLRRHALTQQEAS